MKHYLSVILLVSFTSLVHAQCCSSGKGFTSPRYVCFDGRLLNKTSTGNVWEAKRGCFLSRLPCCAYEASHYGFYPQPHQAQHAFAKCREGYPYRLGEMQTH